MKQDEIALRRERINNVEEVIFSVCKGKGWETSVSIQDEENWKYATISVSKYTGGGRFNGTFEITLDGGFRLVPNLVMDFNSMLNTGGWEELTREVKVQVMKIPWLKTKDPVTKETQKEKVNMIFILEEVIKRFHKVVTQVARRHKRRQTLRVKDEYDVQDLLHALLKALFDDVRAEEVVPSYAGASARLDFLLKEEQIGVEVKMASAKLRDREVGEQLLIDIGRYQAHQNCKTLICLVYDPCSHIRNAPGLRSDLSKKYDSMDVRVLVVP